MRDELQYVINEEKRTVTCIAWNCSGDLYEQLLKKVESDYIFRAIIDHDEQLLLKHKYVGTAKCSPEDTFDIETGKKIARAKMREKYTRDKIKALGNLFEFYEDLGTLLDDSFNALINSYDKNADILQSYNVSY